MNCKKSKKAQFNFEILFAIIAGAAILMLAIYGATKIGDTQSYQKDSEIAKKISILIEPLTGFGETNYMIILFKEEISMENLCFDDGFGTNKISVSSGSGIADKEISTGAGTKTSNKYIFSNSLEKGKELHITSMEFEMPYKIADLIFLSSDKYCFINPPQKVKGDLFSLNIKNIELNNCSSNSVKVCFGSGSECDMIVYDNLGYVKKDNEELYYSGKLLYGAIFSDKDIYKCNVNRLLYRTGKIAEIYTKKADLMNIRGCNTNLKSDLISFSSLTLNADYSRLMQIHNVAEELDKKNKMELLCGLWGI